MTSASEIKSTALEEPLKRAALRRNLRTAAIVGFAFSGGLFSTAGLAASSSIAFVVLMVLRLNSSKYIFKSD